MRSTRLTAKARSVKLSASMEDYLEAILNLSDRGKGEARSTDIATGLGVSKASVTGAVRGLKKKGLALCEPYRTVRLTEAGRQRAAEVANKHRILKSFFETVLGIEGNLAQEAACRVEHAVGEDIVGRLTNFVEFVDDSRKGSRDIVAEFERFCARRPVV